MREVPLQSVRGPVAVRYEFWTGQALRSSRLRPIGLDTETALIEDGREIPDLALAVASDGETNVVFCPCLFPLSRPVATRALRFSSLYCPARARSSIHDARSDSRHAIRSGEI